MSATSVLSRSGARLCLRGASSSLRTLRSPDSVKSLPALSALARYYASKSFPSHTVISMPALSPTMTTGNIGAWQKAAGDSLAPGDVLVEIETDKAQMDFEFQEEGVLAKVLKESGEKDVAVGSPIAVMVEDAGDVSAFESFTIDDAGGNKAPPAEKKPEAAEPQSSTPEPDASETAPAAKESESTGAELQPALDREPSISPAAKKLALEKGVPVGQVKGTGRGGQVTLQDIEKFKPGSGAAPAASGAAVPSFEDIPTSGMRKTIASRLLQSWQQNPHFFVSSSISVTKLLQLRKALNSSADGRYKLSVNDLLVKAIASAARAVPAVNSSWVEEGGNVVTRQHNNVDVSVAVATPVGLITPIIRGADSLGLAAISNQAKALGKRARDGKLKPDEFQGGTITVSNMGMNEAIERFTAVINPPQSTILAIGTVNKVAVPGEVDAESGEPAVKWDDQMVITGSFDHKVVDGAVGGDFMRELKRIVENPLELMV